MMLPLVKSCCFIVTSSHVESNGSTFFVAFMLSQLFMILQKVGLSEKGYSHIYERVPLSWMSGLFAIVGIYFRFSKFIFRLDKFRHKPTDIIHAK